MNSVELIKKLCSVHGPSGFEENVRAEIEKEISPICSSYKVDKMGNLIAPMHFGDKNAEGRKRIMVSAHMDEVGFMINEIKSDGYLGFDCVGGISESVIAGRRVALLSKKGIIQGVIASKAIHHKEKDERSKPSPIKSLYIDIGAADADEAKEYADIGDLAVFDSEFYALGDNCVKGKALDDRMGCCSMIEMMQRFKNTPPQEPLDVYFCFTTREEIGLSGAKAASLRISPDIAIVLETTAIADLPDTPAAKRVADIGNGAVISIMDRSTIYCRQLIDLALSLSAEKNIKAQVKRYVSGGNDAGTIHKVGAGTKVLALSVPTRYLHSPACVASLEDYESLGSLCEEIIRNIGKKEIL